MKMKREHGAQERGRVLSALLALVLAVGLVLTVPALDGPALADPEGGGAAGGAGEDTAGEPGRTGTAGPAMTLDDALADGGCSLTLKFPEEGPNIIGSNGETANIPADSLVVVDVYKLADAVKIPGSQAYQFELKESDKMYAAFDAAIEDGVDGWRKTVSGGVMTFCYAPEIYMEDAREWTELVDQIARACLKNGSGIEPVREGQAFGQPIGGLDPGLYLTVVRGKEIADTLIRDSGDQYKDLPGVAAGSLAYPGYMTAQTIVGVGGALERIPGTAGEFKTGLASIAYNNEYVYYFQPQLVSLPGYSDGGVLNGSVSSGSNTGYTGSWQTSVAMVTKYSAKPRYADLKIVKSLPSYLAGPKSVTFLYRIEAARNGAVVYRTVESISFSGPNASGKETRVIVDRIPVDCTVTVTEFYTTSAYVLDGASAGSEINPGGHDGGLSLGNPSVDYAVRSVTIPANQLPGSIQLNIPADDGFEIARLDVGDTEIVSFRNVVDDTHNGNSGSVVNSFTADKDGWIWTKRAYDQASNAWIEVKDGDWAQKVQKNG